MSFNSFVFIAFFATVLFLYRILRDHRRQNLLLLAAGYVFYGYWSVKFLSLLLISTLNGYTVSHLIFSSKSNSRKKMILAAGIIIDLAILGFFKYYNFGVESLNFLLAHIGLDPGLPILKIVLPLGISFYTFQSIGFMIDVYRGRVEPEHNILTYSLFVTFFPQLVAGPIESGANIIPQLKKKRIVTSEDISIGIQWIIIGYFQKAVIADTLAPLVDNAFNNPSGVSGISSLIAVFAFSCQIYGDFAGYTSIARGTARLLGIHLIENFRMPYLAWSPREFWMHWHISLSSWLKNYLYISLGGNRKGNRRTNINLFLTMLIGGVWHGASWNFVFWGAYHGALLVIYRALGIKDRPEKPQFMSSILNVSITYILVVIGWFFFRARTMDTITGVAGNIFSNFHWGLETAWYLSATAASLALVLGYQYWRQRTGRDIFAVRPGTLYPLGIYLFMIALVVIKGFKPITFIYFQF